MAAAQKGKGGNPPSFTGIDKYIADLKQYLRKNDISYGELSRALGHPEPSQVSRWMNGRSKPRESSIERITRALERIQKARKN